MADAERDLKIVLSSDTSEAESGMSGFGETLNHIGEVALGIDFSQLINQVIDMGKEFVTSSMEAADSFDNVNVKLDQVLLMTQKNQLAASDYKDQLNKLAEALEKQSTFTKTDIEAAETYMVLHTKIGKDVLPQVLQATIDYAAFTGTTAADAAQKFAYALANPERALRLLKDAGVDLDAADQKQLRTWQESGNILQAQNFLLEKLAILHGQAIVATTTHTGQLAIFNRTIEEGKIPIGQWLNAFQLAFLDKVKEAFNYLQDSFKPVLNELESIYMRHKELFDILGKVIIDTLVVAFIALTKILVFLTEKILDQINQWLDFLDKANQVVKSLDNITNHFKPVVDIIKQVYDWISNLIGKFEEFSKKFGGIPGAVAGAAAHILSPIPFASGTNYAPGGLALVGEEGPELVNLPSGSSVTPAAQTSKALGGISVVINYPQLTSDQSVQQLIADIKSALGRQTELARLGAI